MWELQNVPVAGSHLKYQSIALIVLIQHNFRWEFTASYGYDKSNWSAQTTTTDYYTAEIAGVITVNADYFGRPQIKPFVTYLYKDAKDGWGADFDNEKGVLQVGVEAEIWF